MTQLQSHSSLLGLGCPDCTGQNNFPLSGSFDSLNDYLLTAKGSITFYSRPPGDWFPLVNNELTVESGRFLGGIVNYKITESGLWLEANSVSPGWFLYDPAKLDLKQKSTGVTLSPEVKEGIILDIVKTLPGGKILIATGEAIKSTVDLAENTFNLANGIIKYLPFIALAAGGIFVYVKFGDDIKKTFSKPDKSPGLSGTNAPIKEKTVKKVIHI